MSRKPLGTFGVVSDEIHGDPEVAFRVARSWGMEFVDLNSVWDKPVTDLTDDEVQRVRDLANEHGLQVFMVAGLSFKNLPVHGLTPSALLRSLDFKEHMDMLRRSLEIARALNAPCARVQSFRWPHIQGPGNPSPRLPRGGEIPSSALEVVTAGLQAACDLAGEYGVVLGLENVRACYGNSGRNTALIVEAVARPNLKVVWDPANAYVSGEGDPYPSGYEAVRPHIVHVHIKDAEVVDESAGLTAWKCVGEGQVDYVPFFRTLAEDGYEGILCMEPHWRREGLTPEETSRLSLEGTRKALATALAQ